MEQNKIDKINKIISDNKDKLKNLECDGATRVMDYLLTNNKIDHIVMIGEASFKDETIFHYWIKIDDMTLDLKSKMWFGNEVEEGLFKKSRVKYKGKPVELNTTKLMFDILTAF